MTRITRRELLGAATAMGAITVSGCLDRAREEFGGSPGTTDEESPDSGDPTDSDGGDGTDTDSEGGTDSGSEGETDSDPADDGDPDRSATNESSSDDHRSSGIDGASIKTLRADCGSMGDGDVDVDFADGAITVTGTLSAPTPCHEAVFDAVTLEDDHLSVVVDVRSTLEDGQGCVECVGAITYEARVDLGGASTIETVIVEHVIGSESTVTR